MAKVSIRKEDLDRVVQASERAAKRTNERVVVAHDRVELQDIPEASTSFAGGEKDEALVSFH